MDFSLQYFIIFIDVTNMKEAYCNYREFNEMSTNKAF